MNMLTNNLKNVSFLLLFLVAVSAYAQDTTKVDQKGVNIFITQSPKIFINLDGKIDNTCFGDDKGSINITPEGGFPPYKYFWSHGDTTQDVTSLKAGSYRVAVYDGFSCSDTLNVEITEPLELSAEVLNVDDIICYGYNQGAIDIEVTGGVSPYTYSWSNGARTQDLKGVISGEYSVLITDANRCQEIITARVDETPLIVRSLDDSENILCYGDETGSIKITIDGGSPPYSYSWNNGATTQDIDNLGAGSYEVTVTDSKGCTEVYTAKVEQPDQLTINFDELRNVRCFGGEGGAVNIRVKGGVRPYQYKWSNGLETQDIAGVEAGTYSVEITDFNGCIETLEAEITQPTKLEVNLTKSQNVSFYGGSNGSIEIEVTGGVAPYKFKWNDGHVTKDIKGLKSGNYYAKVSDATGCSKILHVTIEQPATLFAKVDRIANINCYGDESGEISISVEGGVKPYNFSWSNGAETEDIINVKAGDYTVVVTDGNNHEIKIDTVLTQPEEFVASLNKVTNILCYGEKTGGIDVNIAGGVPPYKYYWGNGMITQDIVDVPAGKYSLEVLDANRCLIELSGEITQPDEISLTFKNVVNILCYDDNSGSIELEVEGGVAPFIFGWNNGDSTKNLSNIKAGEYEVTVTDSNGCDQRIKTRVTQPELLVIREEKVEDIDCFGNNNGLFNLNISGGIPPYSFDWNTKDTTQNIQNLVAGTYKVTVSDANGCSDTYSRRLKSPTELIVTLDGIVNNLCFEDSEGEVNISVKGGAKPYRYLWNTGATSQDIVNIKSGTYTVQIVDSNGCIDSLTAEVKEAPLMEIAVESVNIACFGESSGAIDITVKGGVAPYKYEWSNGAITQDIRSIPMGQYSVVVTDANGCSDIRKELITEPTRFIAILESETHISCYNQSTGKVIVRISGGVEPYTYLWNNGATTKNIIDIPAGDYELKVSDANGCSEVVKSTIVQPSEVKYTVNKVTNLNCYGDNAGAIDISITGGMGPYQYKWNNGATTQDLINVPAGKYSVEIVEGNGCRNILQAEVTQPQPLKLKLDTIVHVLCNGDNSGVINVSVEGGVAPYKYSWSNGAQTQDISKLTASNYSLTVTDAYGCMKTVTTAIRQPRPFVATLIGVENIKCNGEETGKVQLNVIGGTKPYKFEWSNGATSQNLGNLSAGNYSVKITDANNCFQSLKTVVTQPSPLVVDLVSLSDVSCAGGSDGILNISVTGGTTPYRYMWSNGTQTQDLNDVPAGTYALQITDANGCLDTNIEATITQPGKLIANFGDITHITTYGFNTGIIDLEVSGGVPPYKYSWSNGATTQDISKLQAGNYSVNIMDAQSCEVILATNINQPPELNVTITSVKNILCSGEETGAIEVVVTGGVSPYMFEWNHGDSVQNIYAVPAGDYSLTVLDAQEHRKVVNAKVTEPSPINIHLDRVQHEVCFNGRMGAIDITVTGGLAPYKYTWSNGATSQDLKNIGAGSYDIAVSDQNGCEITLQAEVNQPDQLTSQIVSVDNIKCNGDAIGAIRIEVSGGVKPYRYHWSNGGRMQNIEGVIAGKYDVKITDANGCTQSLNTTISEPPLLSATITQVFHNNCYAEEQGAITIDVSGGFGKYSYFWSNGDTTKNISNLSAGKFDVIIRDSLGCEQKLAAVVSHPQELIASILDVTNINCFGGKEGKIEVDVQGGSAPYEFKWSNGTSRRNLLDVEVGNYSLLITDVNGCNFNLGAEITEPPLLVLELDMLQHNLCKNDEKGFVDITVSGGVTPYEYIWSNGTESEDLVNVIANEYTVMVKDANGCIQRLITEVLEPDLLTIEIDSISNVTCNGDLEGYIGASASGGVGPYSFSWDNGNSGSFIQGVEAGTYEAVVTDSNGCTTSILAEIKEPLSLIYTIDAITDIQCYGDSTGAIYVTVLEGVGPYKFEWSNGETTLDITGLTAGSYSLKITQGNNCESFLEAVVEQPDPFDYEIVNVRDVSCFGESIGAVDIDITGGVEPYIYAWSNGETTQDISNVVADNYSVMVTDANGCLLTINTIIEQPAKFQLAIDSVKNVKCCGDTSGAIYISVTGGVEPYSYNWSNGSTSQDITNLGLGKYTVTVTDALGCEITSLDEDQLDLYEQVVTTGKFITRGIQFNTGLSIIQVESFRIVNKIATLMKEYPDLAFRIDGHTDSDGTAISNQQLSEDRAKSIKKALVKFGIAESRLRTKGWGESSPITSNATRTGKQENRRVEFISLTGTLTGEMVENSGAILNEEEEE